MNGYDPHGITSRWAHSARAGTTTTVGYTMLAVLAGMTLMSLVFGA